MAVIVIVLLGKAEASLFDQARAKLSDWMAPALEGVRAPLADLERWVDGIGTIFNVYAENERLRRENAELRRWQNVALSLERRVGRYELLLHAVPNPEIPSVAARIIGQASHPFIRTMILDAGRGQNVQAGQAVVDDRGLLGRIYLAGDRSSWVILLTDLNSRIPVTIEPSNHRAMMSGDNTPAPELEPNENPGSVKVGDHVVSSGDGGLLPPDLPVGVVIAEGGTLRVSLFSDPNTADFVQVLDYKMPLEPPPGAAVNVMPVAPLPPGQAPAGASPNPARTGAGGTAAVTTPPGAKPPGAPGARTAGVAGANPAGQQDNTDTTDEDTDTAPVNN